MVDVTSTVSLFRNPISHSGWSDGIVVLTVHGGILSDESVHALVIVKIKVRSWHFGNLVIDGRMIVDVSGVYCWILLIVELRND